MSRTKRVLLLSLKAGAGHIRAAEAVREAIEERGGACEVRHIECLQFMTAFFRAGFNGFYGTMLHYTPSIWRMLYERTERQPIESATKSIWCAINRLNAGRLLREVYSFDADSIVCTHFIPAGLLAEQRRRGELRAKLSVVITDYDLHAAWIHSGVDQYCVATDEMAQTLRAGGAQAASVDATGIPIASAFRQPFPDKCAMRERLKLGPSRPAVLLSGGGCGLGRLDHMAAMLSREFPDVQFLTVAGNNKTLLAALQALAIGAKNIFPMGFVPNMHEIMAACDVSVTKPGGLTSSECLAMGLPMILIDPIPGQEDRNARYLVTNGAASLARHPNDVIDKLRDLFQDKSAFLKMSNQAKVLSRSNAALDVYDLVSGSPVREVTCG